MISYRPIDEVIEFIASSPNPKDILAYRPSSALQGRVEDLVYKKKESSLSIDEEKELERYLLIEHLMRMANNDWSREPIHSRIY
jgi:hypothetical protein